MVELKLENISKTFDSPPVTAVQETDLTIEHGEFFTLVGPSGCGKTTLLRMIAGLETPTTGEILFDGERVTDLSPQKRNVAMVFQNIALYPHMSVRENIGYGLKVRGETDNIADKVDEAAELLSISDQLDKNPSQLSGGQQQRVALGRAIVRNPNLILLDEPMSDLDAKLKSELRVMVQELHQEIDTTIIYVTHDQKEAMTMSTLVGLMSNGSFEQVSPPNEIYDFPQTEFAAKFIGQPSMNIVDGRIEEDGLLRLSGDDGCDRHFDVSNELEEISSELENGGPVKVGVRPQHIQFSNTNSESILSLHLDLIEQDGNQFNLYLTSKAGDNIIGVMYEQPPYEVDDTLGITGVQRLYLFHSDSGTKLAQLDSEELTYQVKGAQ